MHAGEPRRFSDKQPPFRRPLAASLPRPCLRPGRIVRRGFVRALVTCGLLRFWDRQARVGSFGPPHTGVGHAVQEGWELRSFFVPESTYGRPM